MISCQIILDFIDEKVTPGIMYRALVGMVELIYLYEDKEGYDMMIASLALVCNDMWYDVNRVRDKQVEFVDKVYSLQHGVRYKPLFQPVEDMFNRFGGRMKVEANG